MEDNQNETDAVVRRLEKGQNMAKHLDTPPERFIHPAATAALPVDELADFARAMDPQGWAAISDDERKFFANLKCKLDPIVQLIPALPTETPPVVGFECLALGPKGESFPEILKAIPKGINPDLPRFLLLVAAVRTADMLRSGAQVRGITGARNLFFSVNLDKEMAASPLFGKFMDRYGPLMKQNFFFELNENTSDVTKVKELQGIHKLHYLMDDLDKWQDVLTVAELEKCIEGTKIDFTGFQRIKRNLQHGQTKLAIKILKKFMYPGKPLIIEGLETEDDFRLLANNWPNPSPDRLYAQGYGVVPSPPWNEWVADLRDFGHKGGWILANPFLANVSKTIRASLTSDEKLKMSLQFDGPTMRITLPGLDLVAVPANLKVNEIKKLSHKLLTITQELDSSIPGEQILLNELSSHIQVWRRGMELGHKTLNHAPHQHAYPKDRYQTSLVLELQQGKVTIPTDGVAQLLAWLENDSPPFCALLGDYGMGKTFLCRMLTQQALEERKNKPQLPVPFYLDMRLLPTWQDNRTPTLKEMVTQLCEKSGFSDISVDAVLTAVRMGRVALIFDGFDEKAANLNEGESSSLLTEIRRAAPPQTRGKVLISCRTHYFLNRKDEQAKVVGGTGWRTRDGFQTTDFRMLYLQPFDDERIKNYLEKLFTGRSEEIFTFFKTVHDIMDLAQRPFLLFLMSENLEELMSRAKSGRQVEAADVYDTVIEAWLDRDIGKHHISKPIKLLFMEELARRLWNDGVRQIHVAKFQKWLRNRMQEHLAVVNLAELDRVDTEMRTAAFLGRDPDGNYSFAHTSFQEFFLAKSIVNGLSKGNQAVLDLPRLNKEIVAFTLDLLAGLVKEADKRTGLLKEILENTYQTRITENALLLTLAWQKRPHSATHPRPRKWELAGADLAGMDLTDARLDPVNLAGANLSNAQLRKARIRGSLQDANLSRIDALDADLETCNLTSCDLTGANLRGTRLKGANLNQAQALSTFLQRADLTNATLDGTILTMTRLAWATVTNGQLEQAKISSCSRLSTQETERACFGSSIQSWHSDDMTCAAVSLDGRLIVSGSQDGTLKIWDRALGIIIRTLMHGDNISCLAISQNGNIIISGSFDHLKIWNSNTGSHMRTLQGHSATVLSVAISQDGESIVSGSADESFIIWDLATGSPKHTYQGNSGSIRSVAISPDGKTIITGNQDHTLEIWNLTTGFLQKTLQGHSDQINSVAISTDGAFIVSGSDDNMLIVWDRATGSRIKTLEGHSAPVNSVAISTDGAFIVSGSTDRTLKIWNRATGSRLHTLQGHFDSVKYVAFSPDGNSIISGSNDDTLKIWDRVTGFPLHTLQGSPGWALSVAISQDGGFIVSCSADKTLKIWDRTNESLIHTLNGHSNYINSVAISPDGASIVSGSDDKTLKIWNLTIGSLHQTLKGHSHLVLSVAISPDGKFIVSGSADTTLKIWNLTTGSLLHTLKGHSDWVRSVAISPNGKSIVSGSDDKTLKIWNLTTGSLLHTLKGHSHAMSVAISPDGKSIVSGSDKTLKIWDLTTGSLLHTLEGHSDWVKSVAISSNGKFIISGSDDNTIMKWDCASGNLIESFQGESGKILSVAISHDGHLIISGGSDGKVKIWDFEACILLATLWADEQGEWLVLTPDNSFDGSDAGLKQLGFVHQNCVYPASEFVSWRQKGLLGVVMGKQKDQD